MFDPLDGSSNVDANIPTGTIFGVYEESESMENCVLDGARAPREAPRAAREGAVCVDKVRLVVIRHARGESCPRRCVWGRLAPPHEAARGAGIPKGHPRGAP